MRTIDQFYKSVRQYMPEYSKDQIIKEIEPRYKQDTGKNIYTYKGQKYYGVFFEKYALFKAKSLIRNILDNSLVPTIDIKEPILLRYKYQDQVTQALRKVQQTDSSRESSLKQMSYHDICQQLSKEYQRLENRLQDIDDSHTMSDSEKAKMKYVTTHNSKQTTKPLERQKNFANRGNQSPGSFPFFVQDNEYVLVAISRNFENIVRAYSLARNETNLPENPHGILRYLYEKKYNFIFPQHKIEMSFEDFILLLRQEYIVINNGYRKIKLSIFREINEQKSGSDSKGLERFAGGIFHTLDHFDGFGWKTKGYEPYIPFQFYKNLIRTILKGRRIISKLQENGNYRIIQQCDLIWIDVKNIREGELTPQKKQNYQVVLFYNAGQDVYHLDTWYPAESVI